MTFRKAISTTTLSQFKQRLVDRVRTLAVEFKEDEFVFPVVLALAIDEQHGGDSTAREFAKRFTLLDLESRNALDFYFLGWRPRDVHDVSKGVEFDLAAFEECRDALRRIGIPGFGGNADLIVCDARYKKGRVSLDFTKALHINLSEAEKNHSIENLGSFLQAMIDAASSLRAGEVPASENIAFRISDKLGLAVARESILAFILEKWGKLIGAKKLAVLATRRVGPEIDLAKL